MGRKSRHVRDESDPLLQQYSRSIAATSSVRFYNNPLHSVSPSTMAHKTYSERLGSFMTGSSAGSGVQDDPDEDTGFAMNHHQQQDTSTYGSYAAVADDRGTPSPPTPTSPRKNCRQSLEDSYSSRSLLPQVRKKRKKKARYRVHRVSYTAQNHVQVLFRMYGSAFPQVFPFVLANLAWAVVVILCKNHNVLDLTFHSSVGHSFMGLLVSFLVVSRSKISYDRFMDFRRCLATTYRSSRDLVQFMTVYSFQTQTAAAKQWRQEVSYRMILLLRVTMDALLWSSTEGEKWEAEYFKYHHDADDGDDYASDMDDDDEEEQQADISEHFFRFQSLTHGRRSMIDENFRAPISFAHVLRMTIMEHPQYLGYKLAVNEYRDLLDFVTQFLAAFHEFRVLIFTPYPFPLVQMTRTFLFFWVYSLPLTLLKEYRFWSSAVILVFVTFGFIGVEYVSMALDDPFGDDTNDVDEHGMALLVYEDIYLALYRTDGYSAACQLRERVLARYRQGRSLDCYRNDLKGYDFWEQHLPHDYKTSDDEDDDGVADDDSNPDEE